MKGLRLSNRKGVGLNKTTSSGIRSLSKSCLSRVSIVVRLCRIQIPISNWILLGFVCCISVQLQTIVCINTDIQSQFIPTQYSRLFSLLLFAYCFPSCRRPSLYLPFCFSLNLRRCTDKSSLVLSLALLVRTLMLFSFSLRLLFCAMQTSGIVCICACIGMAWFYFRFIQS